MSPLHQRLLLAASLAVLFGPAAGEGSLLAQPVPSPTGAKPLRTDLYGDPLPDGAIARLGTVRFRHPLGFVYRPVFLPDGKTLLALGLDGRIRRWDVATGKELAPVGDNLRISLMALAPDGKSLAYCHGFDDPPVQPRDVHLWDMVRDRKIRVLGEEKDQRNYIDSLAFDGKTVATAGHDSGVIRLYDARTGKKLRELAGRRTANPQIALSPDGKILASWGTSPRGGATVCRWEVETGKELPPVAEGTFSRIFFFFLPDGNLITVDWDGTICLWETATGKELRRFRGHQHPLSVAVSPGGKVLASGGGIGMPGEAILWDLATGQELRRFEPHPQAVKSVAFAPDGKLLATASDTAIRLWDVATGRLKVPLGGHPCSVTSLAYAPDGKTLVSAGHYGEGIFRAWDTASGKPLHELPGHAYGFPRVVCTAYAPDGKILATASGDTIRLWDAATGRLLRRLKGPEVTIDCLVFLPDGRTLTTAHADGTICLWEAATGKLLRQAKVHCPSKFLDFALSPDGKILATCSAESAEKDERICLWDTATGRFLRRFARGQEAIGPLAFSPDGKTLLAMHWYENGLDQVTLRGWETSSGRERWRFDVATSPGAIYRAHLAFSPDGRFVAVPPTQDVHVLDLATSKSVRSVRQGPATPRSLAFAPDGRALAVGYYNSTVLTWDLNDLPRALPGPNRKLAPEELQMLWTALASKDASAAYRARWTLAAVAEQSVAWLRERLQPVAEPDPRRVQRLLADLDNDQFAVREETTRQLEALGDLAAPALQEVLDGRPSLEVRRRAEQLLERLRRQEFSGEELRALRGIEVLEHLGTEPAREVLQRLAKGTAGARLTHEAKASLERLTRRP